VNLDGNGGKPAGCAAQCIIKARLTPNASNPDLGLEVKTHTPARIRVYVGKNPPQQDQDGDPFFPGAAPNAQTDQLTTAWTTLLAPLEAGTQYHIVVQAIDANGGESHRVGSFKTREPIANPGGGGGLTGSQPGGCSVQCITNSRLFPTAGSATIRLEVETHTPARIQAYVDEQPPETNQAGEPYFPGAQPVASTGNTLETDWAADLELEFATNYHIVVKATDENAWSQFHTGDFRTPDEPVAHEDAKLLVTFHKIHVSYDGDKGANRGELRFRFAVGDPAEAKFSLGERKIHSNTTINLDDGNRSPGIGVVADLPGDNPFLPLMRVQGWKRHPDGRIEFCSAGGGLAAADHGRISDCDVVFNTASGPGLVRVDDLDRFARCSDFGLRGDFQDSRCVVLRTLANGEDVPRFEVLASLDTLP